MNNEVRIFKALADETRLSILALLLDGELCVCEVIAALELPQSTVSRHLAYLRNSSWVLGRRQGIWMYYRLNADEQGLIKELLPALEKYVACKPEHDMALERLHKFQEEQNQQAC